MYVPCVRTCVYVRACVCVCMCVRARVLVSVCVRACMDVWVFAVYYCVYCYLEFLMILLTYILLLYMYIRTCNNIVSGGVYYFDVVCIIHVSCLVDCSW